MGGTILLVLSLTPLFQSAQNLAREGRCDAALPLFLQIAFTPGSAERGEALLHAAWCSLPRDTALADLLLHRFLEDPDPDVVVLRRAWEVFRTLHPEAESLTLFAPYMVALPPDTLVDLSHVPGLPDSLRVALFTLSRSYGVEAPPPSGVALPCPWVLARGEDPAHRWLCRGDTLRAMLVGPPPVAMVRDWILRDSLRCYPGDALLGCSVRLDSVMRWTPDSLRDSVLSLWERWGRGWPESRERWRLEWRWETTGHRPDTFLPRVPAPSWERRVFAKGKVLDPRDLLRRMIEVFQVEGWPAPRTGNPDVDRLLFQIHALRWKRDRFWGQETPGQLDSLVVWMHEVAAPPYELAIEVAKAARLPRLPFKQIPLKSLSDRALLALASWMGQQGMERPFREMARLLPDPVARRVRFAFAVARGWADTAFLYLDVKNPSDLRAYMRIIPSPWEVLSLYPLQARRADVFLLERALGDTGRIPLDRLKGFLARPLAESLRLALVHRLYPQALQRGDLETAGLLALHDTLSPYARLVRFFLRIHPDPPPVDSATIAILPETLRVWLESDTLPPLPPESLAVIPGYRDRVRAWRTMMLRDTLIPSLLQGSVPPGMRAFGLWVHRKARALYREGKRGEAARLWRFLLRSGDRTLEALALYHLGVFHKDEQRPDEALRYLSRLHREYGDQGELWTDGTFLLGGLMSQQGDPEGALRVYRSLRGLLDREGEGERLYWEMQALKALQRYPEAVVVGQILWRRFRDGATGWAITAALDVAQFWVLRGRPDRARALLREIVETAPRHPLTATARRQLEGLEQLERLRGR